MLIRALGTRRTITAEGWTQTGHHGECIVADWGGRRPTRSSSFRVVSDLGEKNADVGSRALEGVVHVLVLTHDDDDHIGGAARALQDIGRLPSLLSDDERRGERIGQVWMPVDWWYAVQSLLVLFSGDDAGEGPGPAARRAGEPDSPARTGTPADDHVFPDRTGCPPPGRVPRGAGSSNSAAARPPVTTRNLVEDMQRSTPDHPPLEYLERTVPQWNEAKRGEAIALDEVLGDLRGAAEKFSEHSTGGSSAEESGEWERAAGAVRDVLSGAGITDSQRRVLRQTLGGRSSRSSENRLAKVLMDILGHREGEDGKRAKITAPSHRSVPAAPGDLRRADDDKENTAIARRILSTTGRLLEVVQAAARVSYIRWFSVDCGCGQPVLTQGYPGAVTLINAHEVALPRGPGYGAAARTLTVARLLTSQNERALAMWIHLDVPGRADPPESWGADHPVFPHEHALGRGFAVWSDTDSATCEPLTSPGPARVPWDKVAGMTAPHHGSDESAHTWFWAQREAAEAAHLPRVIPVLLSNNKHRTREEFNALSAGRGFATHPDEDSSTASGPGRGKSFHRSVDAGLEWVTGPPGPHPRPTWTSGYGHV